MGCWEIEVFNLDEVYIKVDIFIDTVSLELFELPENSVIDSCHLGNHLSGLLTKVLLMTSEWYWSDGTNESNLELINDSYPINRGKTIRQMIWNKKSIFERFFGIISNQTLDNSDWISISTVETRVSSCFSRFSRLQAIHKAHDHTEDRLRILRNRLWLPGDRFWYLSSVMSSIIWYNRHVKCHSVSDSMWERLFK